MKDWYQFLRNHLILTMLLVSIISVHEKGQVENMIISRLHMILLVSAIIILMMMMMWKRRSSSAICYLVEYACYKPPCHYRVPYSTFIEHARLVFDEKSLEFQRRILQRSGLGEETCLPPTSHEIPPAPSLAGSREEAEELMFGAVESVLGRTGVSPKDVGIVIVNCSLFAPTPSLAAMLVNRFKMRSNVKSFHLSGMGCSAGLISIDMARRLLQVHPESYALVVSTEIISPNYYIGGERSMLLPNCLFRMGGAALLLSNRRGERGRAKYRLAHVVRTHMGGSSDQAYGCVYQEEDPAGTVGTSLSKDLMAVAGEALRANIRRVGPLVLPASQQALFLLGARTPDFTRAFDHLCIHAGGRAVIDQLQKSLRLSPAHVEASRMTLHRFGNTSSSSLWYEMSYVEAKGRMKKGDTVWQIAFGSGFKCNSALWRCNRNIDPPTQGPWLDSIHSYPLQLPDQVLNI